MTEEDSSRFATVAREYAAAEDAMDAPAGSLGTYTERELRRRAAAKRYRRELRRLGFEPPGVDVPRNGTGTN